MFQAPPNFKRLNETVVSTLSEAAGETIDVSTLKRETPAIQKKISDLWTDGVEYKGTNVFDAVYGSFVDKVQRLVTVEMKDLGGLNPSSQESYLAYSPSKDLFVLGFDAWCDFPEEDDEDEWTETENASGLAFFEIKNGKAQLPNSRNGIDIIFGKMMYTKGGGRDELKRKFSDLIEIRLD